MDWEAMDWKSPLKSDDVTATFVVKWSEESPDPNIILFLLLVSVSFYLVATQNSQELFEAVSHKSFLLFFLYLFRIIRLFIQNSLMIKRKAAHYTAQLLMEHYVHSFYTKHSAIHICGLLSPCYPQTIAFYAFEEAVCISVGTKQTKASEYDDYFSIYSASWLIALSRHLLHSKKS